MPAFWVVWLLLCAVGRCCFSRLVWALLTRNLSYLPGQYKTTSQLQSFAILCRAVCSCRYLHQSTCLKSSHCLAQFHFATCLHTIPLSFSCFALLTVPSNHFGVTYTLWLGS